MNNVFLKMLKSKIHRATVTGADIEYEGSIGIDASLLSAAKILPNEQVDVYNIDNGERLTTYAIELPRGCGEIVLNGAAARKASVGDRVIICTYILMDPEMAKVYSPHLVMVDKENKRKNNQ